MPRINIEDSLFSDDRFREFSILIGDEDRAIGLAYRFFRLAQTYYCPDRKGIPKAKFEKMKHSKEWLECGLARKKRSGFYVTGSEAQFAWLCQKFDAGRKSAKLHNKKDHERGTEVEFRGTSSLLYSASARPQGAAGVEKQQKIFPSSEETFIDKIRKESIAAVEKKINEK